MSIGIFIVVIVIMICFMIRFFVFLKMKDRQMRKSLWELVEKKYFRDEE